jgi:hypothetical protein
MSPSIWTRCAASSEPTRLDVAAWRVVEGQHVVSTRKLVDSDAEQHLLEELIETVKPPLPAEARDGAVHYLLTTPLRYPPRRHGSRFGGRGERSLWYGSREQRTAFAETAYYRLLFPAAATRRSAFSRPRPSPPETWYCIATRDGVEMAKRDVFRHRSHAFPRRQFEVAGRLPAPAF